MKVIVCGGRDFENEAFVFQTLDEVHAVRPITLIIEGGARGADFLAGKWARDRNIPLKVVQADWKKHGRGAGPIRNREMADLEPDEILAFPGGSGTASMCNIAMAQGVPVRMFYPE